MKFSTAIPILLSFVIFITLPIICNADMYKWRDTDGVLHFSDVQLSQGTTFEKINEHKHPISTPVLAGQCHVTHVIDGDTIDVIYDGHEERVRLLCVDTPESIHPDESRNTSMGRKASEYTQSRLTDKTVYLEFESKIRGKYGRLLAYVILDGQNFNIELVREGWSPYYTKYGNSKRHHAEFKQAEKLEYRQKNSVSYSGSANCGCPKI